MPVAFGGRREVMDAPAPTGPVIRRAPSGNPIAMAAGFACLRLRLPERSGAAGVHETLTELTNQLAQGLLDAARGALCDEFGALLIIDEVMTASRVGAGRRSGYYGVEPDLTCLGKSSAADGAFGGRREVMDARATGPVRRAPSGNPTRRLASPPERSGAAGVHETLTERPTSWRKACWTRRVTPGSAGGQ